MTREPATVEALKAAKWTLALHLNMGRNGHVLNRQCVEFPEAMLSDLSKRGRLVERTLFIGDVPVRGMDLERAVELINEQRGQEPACRPCVECGGAAELVGGDVIYPHRADLHGRRFWRCACGAYVGCHLGSKKPLGAPAGPATRKARNAAHKAFDPLWLRKMKRDGCGKKKARMAAYAWLADQMGLAREDTHIAMFNAEQCARVVLLCEPFQRKAAA